MSDKKNSSEVDKTSSENKPVKTFKGKAKKDFKISFNKYEFELKKGEEFEVPELFKANLKTEKVI